MNLNLNELLNLMLLKCVDEYKQKIYLKLFDAALWTKKMKKNTYNLCGGSTYQERDTLTNLGHCSLIIVNI